MELKAILLILKLIDLKKVHLLEDHNNEFKLYISYFTHRIARKLRKKISVSKGVNTCVKRILKEFIDRNKVLSLREISLVVHEGCARLNILKSLSVELVLLFARHRYFHISDYKLNALSILPLIDNKIEENVHLISRANAKRRRRIREIHRREARLTIG